MLQLILGRAGSGKTYTVYEEITARVQAGERDILLLVPEQFSFESERTLLRRLGVQDAAAVQVLSFTRLADTVARECGGFSGRLMDDVTRTLLMSRALAEVQDQLVLYRRHAARADYVKTVLDVVAECKQYAVTPHQLAEAAATLPAGTLRQKLSELSTVMEAYAALVADSYVDPADALTRLAEQLPESDMARGASVFVDGFRGFTQQELAVLALVMRRAKSVTVTLCTDTLDTRDEYALFAPVSRTAARFVRLARDNGVEVAAPRHLTENHRAKAEALAVLEQGAFLPDAPVYAKETAAVTVAPLADRYAECRTLARELRRLMREEGVRCRDVAVTARNLADYRGILDTALAVAGIPFYMDQREDVHSEPLVALVQSALRCVAGGWRAESVLQLMKTGLLGFSAPSIARMENYIYTWKLNGRRLREEWTANPEGFSVQVDDTTRRTLHYLNILRHRLVTPLARLGDTLHDPVSGLDFAKAVYRYLSDSQVPRLVRLQVRRLEAAGDPLAAGRMERLWELLMELLDRFGAALRTTVLSAARFEELFSLAVASLDMGNIPQGLDAVQVGSAERMRFSAPRFVWVLGANEGVFPAYPATGGLFSDRERRQLAAAGVELSETGDREAVEERLFAYLALAAPSERLYISYLTGAGEVPPSALVETVCRLVPEHATLTGGEMPESAADAFHRLAIGFREPAGEEAALKAYFEADTAYTGRLSAMERAAAGAPFAFQSAAVAQDLFGRHLTLSATQVDTFYNCRFAYFCRYGLRVMPRRPAELDGLEFGNLAHHVMQTVLPRYVAANFKGVTRPVVVADTKAAVTQYIEEFMGGTADKTERFLTLTARLSRTVESLLWQVVRELRQSRFQPVDYELPVGMEGGVPATTLTLPEGGDIRVIGKIDRVDVFKAGTTPYVRVVDYKTGHKDFRLSEVAAGINLQMLLYIFSLWDNGAARYGGDVTPAGVLYLPAKLPVVKVTADTEAEQREREQTKAMRMNGLLLDNPEILEAMEADVAGLFIPAKLKKDGTPDAHSSVASLAQFGRLKNRVEQLLCQMGEQLHRGDVAAVPVSDGKNLDGCEHCPYNAVCGHEPGDATRMIDKTDAAEVWRELEEG